MYSPYKILDSDKNLRRGFTICGTSISITTKRDLAEDVAVESRDDLQQRGFPCTVETEHADLRTVEKRKVDIFEDVSVRRDDFADANHGEDDFVV